MEVCLLQDCASTYLLDVTDIVALLFLSYILVVMCFSHVQMLVWMLIEES